MSRRGPLRAVTFRVGDHVQAFCSVAGTLGDKLGARYVTRFRKDANELYGEGDVAAPRLDVHTSFNEAFTSINGSGRMAIRNLTAQPELPDDTGLRIMSQDEGGPAFQVTDQAVSLVGEAQKTLEPPAPALPVKVPAVPVPPVQAPKLPGGTPLP